MYDLWKDFIIFYIVVLTNVFSCGGVNSWNVFSFRSLWGSRLMNYQTMFLMCRGRTSNRNCLDNKGLYGSSPVSLLCFFFLVGGASSVVALVLRFLASASAALVFLNSEANVGTLGFEPVTLAGKTM